MGMAKEFGIGLQHDFHPMGMQYTGDGCVVTEWKLSEIGRVKEKLTQRSLLPLQAHLTVYGSYYPEAYCSNSA